MSGFNLSSYVFLENDRFFLDLEGAENIVTDIQWGHGDLIKFQFQGVTYMGILKQKGENFFEISLKS
jgi:hypothetical protein